MTQRRAVAVCVFAKPPQPGACKTRLAAAVGDDAAAEVARAMLLDTWDVVTALEGVTPILATTDVAFDHGLGPVTAWDQGGGDLGARQVRVLQRALVDHDAALAVGADIGSLTPELLAGAVAQLREHGAVLGPAEDGGYWILGLTRCPDDLLDGVAWSVESTGAEVLARLTARLGVVAIASTAWDVDELVDLRRAVTRPGRLGAVARTRV